MLNETPAADTEAHSVQTEAISLPKAAFEAQLGQQGQPAGGWSARDSLLEVRYL